MRAFFCIPIPDPLRGELRDTAERLRNETQMNASWVPRSNYHITLRFLGDIDPALSVRLEDLCRVVCGSIAPFECIFDRVGAFPNINRPRVIWAGGEIPPSFSHLSQTLAAGLVDLGFPNARKESLVHVTLARIKDRPDPGLTGLISELNPIAPLKMTVDRIVLMESTLTQQGARYSPLFTARLEGIRT